MITVKRLLTADLIEDALKTVEPILPTPFYWMDKNGVVLGINDLCLKAIGATREIIGKKPYAFYKKEIADHILQHNAEVIKREEILSQEESIEDVATKEIKHFSSIKAPLYDDEGKVIGIVGTSIEITAQKEAEQLRLKNENSQKLIFEEQEKFQKIASQVAHDIRSPLASLLMITKACQQIPEKERIALREAANTIENIAHNLLKHYGQKENATENESGQLTLVSSLLLQIIAEKQYQYHSKNIQFHHDFTSTGISAFIMIEPTALKRAVSNIINNAVDAFEDGSGNINIKLNATEKEVIINVTDNGKGMSQATLNKIRQSLSVTEGKAEGHGIGLTQVREAVEQHHGQLFFNSTMGEGTAVILMFPKSKKPVWMAEQIVLNTNDIVVILDDDNSIHAAWDSRLKDIAGEYSSIQVHHFTEATDALTFVRALPETDQEKVFLLADYELLKQSHTGLDVIAALQDKRSLLVTSHDANAELQAKVTSQGTRILPKQLASDILIEVAAAGCANDHVSVDLIFVDDDADFIDLMCFSLFEDKAVKHYQDPLQFLEEMNNYPKDSKIFIDNRFRNANISGVELAEKLHLAGFGKLYLFTCDAFFGDEIPGYLRVVSKTDIPRLQKAAQK